MRFPSVSALLQRAGDVLRRYPLTLALAAVAAGCSAAAVDHSGNTLLWRIALVALLGLSLSTGVALLSAHRGWSAGRQALWQVAGLILLALFFWSWPGPEQKADMIRFLQLAAVFHLAVAVLPFIRGRETTAFWQYNRRLFESFLRAALFAAVLFVGLAIALGALDKLFGVHVASEAYVRLWLVLAFLVHPWIFLSGAPGVPEELESRSYPKALKVFTQYVLTPLVTIYLVIVVVYLAKIIITGEWPVGWTGYLVASVSVAGLLGFLLVHPLRTDPDESWIRLYSRGLFIGLIPAAVMLLLALWQRVAAFGLTPLRTLGLVLGIWLLCIAILYTLSRGTSIRTIPLSLGAVLAACFAGPLGVRTLSVNSQASRLTAALASTAAGDKRAAAAGGAVDFLLEYRAAPQLRRIFGDSALTGIRFDSVSWSTRDSLTTQLLALKGVTYTDAMRRANSMHITRSEGSQSAIAISGFDWMVNVTTPPDSTALMLGSQSLRLQVNKDRTRLTVQLDSAPPVRFTIDSMWRRLQASDGTPAGDSVLRAERTSGDTRIVLNLRSVYGSMEGDILRLSYWSGQLLVGPQK